MASPRGLSSLARVFRRSITANEKAGSFLPVASASASLVGRRQQFTRAPAPLSLRGLATAAQGHRTAPTSKSSLIAGLAISAALAFWQASKTLRADSPEDASEGTDSSASDEEEELPLFTLAEVAKHNSRDDCWLIIDGQVHDATAWLASHPGGKNILATFAGKDVSREYRELAHSSDADAIRTGLVVGKVKDYVAPTTRGLADIQVALDDAQQPGPRPPTTGSTTPKQRLLIVGAGICGVSAAYHLSLDPAIIDRFDITVIDRSHLVGGTALKSSAIMYSGPLLEARAANNEAVGLAEWLGQMSFEMSARVQREWEDIGFHPRPMLGLANSPDELAFAKRACKGTDRLLTPEEAVEQEPALAGSKGLAGAVLKQGCFTMDPFSLCNAYAKRAKVNGVKFVHGIEVISMDKLGEAESGAGVDLLVKPAGSSSDPTNPPTKLHADLLLLCAGPWDNPLAAQLSHDVPVKPMHGQMLAVRLPPGLPELKHLLFSYEGPLYWAKNRDGHNSTLGPLPELERKTNHFYGVQSATADGVCKFGGDRVAGDLGGVPISEGLEATKRKLADLLPIFADAPVIGRGWGGTMPFTPDQNVIVGELERGIHVCTGAAFTKGGASGMLLAAEVSRKYGKGEWLETVPGKEEIEGYLEKCSPKRFKKIEQKRNEGMVEAAAPAAAAAAVAVVAPVAAPPPVEEPRKEVKRSERAKVENWKLRSNRAM